MHDIYVLGSSGWTVMHFFILSGVAGAGASFVLCGLVSYGDAFYLCYK